MEKTIKKTKINDDSSKSVWFELLVESSLKHGQYIKYFPNSEQIQFDNYYCKGEYDGMQTEYHENGSIKRIQITEKGKLVGKDRKWYPNENFEWIHNYSMTGSERFDGNFEEWYEDGKRKCAKTYSDGHIVGKSRRWCSNGKMLYKMNYTENEIRDGLQYWYHENGNLREISKYTNGKKVGLTVKWDDTGIVEEVYRPDGSSVKLD